MIRSKLHIASYVLSVILLIAIAVVLVKYYQRNKAVMVSNDIMQCNDDIVFGNPDAEIAVVMYGNYQCSHCLHFMKEELPSLLKQKYNGKEFKLIFRFIPFEFNKKARDAYETAMCVNKYGDYQKFHEMLLFDFSLIYSNEYQELLNYIMMHNEAIASAVANHEFENKINQNITFLKERNLKGTPIFIINQKVYRGSIPINEFQSILNSL